MRKPKTKRPPPEPIRLELRPAAEDRTDVAVAIVMRWLDEADAREGR